MIFWEDDTAFITLLDLLKVAIVWMESPEYKVFFGSIIYELNIDTFYHALSAYKRFISQVRQTRLQKLFNYSYAIIEPSTQLIEVLLYPNYSPGDL